MPWLTNKPCCRVGSLSGVVDQNELCFLVCYRAILGCHMGLPGQWLHSGTRFRWSPPLSSHTHGAFLFRLGLLLAASAAAPGAYETRSQLK